MSDDTERRLRDALHDAALPRAPESMRASLREIVANAPGPVRSRPRWLGAAPALAAAVALVVVVGVMTGGFGQLGATGSSASPSSALASPRPEGTTQPGETQPPEPPAPPTSVHVLTPVELYTELFAAQAGRGVAHDVVANVGATPTGDGGVSACADPLGTCTDVAALDGFSPLGTVTVRSEDGVLPPPVTAEDLRAPLALRIVPGGPTELLGHVDLASGSGQVDTAGLKAQTGTAAPGHVVAVLGWLQSALSPSCGPVMPADVPSPFTCPGEPSFLADSPVNASTGNGFSIPDTAVQVGAFTYDKFAPSPHVDSAVGVPRQGMYLVRMVAVDNADCRACRGWLLVGRLDATDGAPTPSMSTPSAAPNAGARVYATAQLAAMLAADRASWVGKSVLVDGSLDGLTPGACVSAALDQSGPVCQWGVLVGTSEEVVATRYTTTLVKAAGLAGSRVTAFRVQPDGLEYLGWMGAAGGGDFTASVADLTATAAQPPQGPVTLIVTAWLGTTGPLPCPSVPGSPRPADTPFGSTCPSSWLAPGDQQAGFAMPEGGVRVQFTAYQDFAAPDGSLGGPPRLGTYLVRLVTDTRQGTNGPRGWQVVARLSPWLGGGGATIALHAPTAVARPPPGGPPCPRSPTTPANRCSSGRRRSSGWTG